MSGPRIALIGSRGIPARYGGFETLIEELAGRLSAQGFRVTVYCRSHFTPRHMRTHRGAELVVLPSVRGKYFDTPVHTLLSCLHAAWRRYDAALVVNSANVLFLPLLGLAGTPVALNVDGIEKQRAKWGRLGRAIYALCERLSTLLPDMLVTDAEVIRRFYLERYGCDSTVIAYGVDPRLEPPGETLSALGLTPLRYFLYVSRFEPENNPHRVAAAFRRVRGDIPLVMVGGAPYASRFIRSFTSGADPRILFPGPLYGRSYRELQSSALCYIQATAVGGTHPALVEAMGYGNLVVANDTPENREVAGDAALYFSAELPSTLTHILERIRRQPRRFANLRKQAARRARERYSWNPMIERYQELFESLIGSSSG